MGSQGSRESSLTSLDATSRAQLYTGGVRDYPGFKESWSPEMRERARVDLGACESLVPGLADRLALGVSPFADVEDFWEDVARMAAAVRSCELLGLPITQVHPASVEWTAERRARRLGPVLAVEEHLRRDPFAMHPALVEFGGRSIVVATYFEDRVQGDLPEGVDVADALADIARRGHCLAVVKGLITKSGVARVRVADAAGLPLPREELLDLLAAEMEWGLYHNSDRPSLLVQPHIPMTHEYRFFVVDGRIVTGAGCVEEYTPYDAPGRLACASGEVWLDPRTRTHRGVFDPGASREEPAPRTGVVELLRAQAELVVAAHPGTYVLDMAVRGDTCEVVVVEVNRLPNSGLYASDPDAVFSALLVAGDRGYPSGVQAPREAGGDISAGERVVDLGGVE